MSSYTMDLPPSLALLSWRHVAAAIALYLFCIALYRITFHPLARFPGPKLAAITRFYEAYYDVVQDGQYTFKIAEMHRKYGPIVRISPYELHVNDLAFHNTLYRQDAHYEKYDWMVDAFGSSFAMVFTTSHDLHKSRRQPLSPFFSKVKVASQKDMIQGFVDKLCHRISKYAETETSFNLGAATTAFTRDVANDFLLGKNYGCLDREDFDIAMLVASQGSGQVWRLSKHIRGLSAAVLSLPIGLVVKMAGQEMESFLRHMEKSRRDTQELMATASSHATDKKTRSNVVHEIMNSKLPPSEKTLDRIFQEVGTIGGAAFETTAGVLRLVFFHVYSNAEMLQRLRAELASAGETSSKALDLKTLEQLPYLTAILMEGLRLNPGVATRLQRVSPHTDLFYNEWRIPAGTPVGMTSILMHKDEDLYPEPERFNPDRWMDPEAKKKTEKGFAPFSKGQRDCLGRYLAWAELYLALATLVQRFDIQFPSAKAEDFDCISDQFAIGTRGKGSLQAIATHYQA